MSHDQVYKEKIICSYIRGWCEQFSQKHELVKKLKWGIKILRLMIEDKNCDFNKIGDKNYI